MRRGRRECEGRIFHNSDLGMDIPASRKVRLSVLEMTQVECKQRARNAWNEKPEQ